ncbi:hypothetical protein AMTRI_Chr03g44600 [Amborella trichopoda]
MDSKNIFFLFSFFCFQFSVAAIHRSSFPKDFIFGTASASYQYEGGANEGRRGPSIWDVYTHEHPERIQDRSNGDVADDSYHRYKEDIKLMKDMGMDAYRFSISWSRVLPKGSLKGGVNEEGIAYYNNLINGLISKGLKPFVTMFHWDLPQALDDEYEGFLSPKIVADFADYANLCFSEFGDRVKHWITLNEPWSYSDGGYGIGLLAPGRCSSWMANNCSKGNSGTEPYVVAHNLLHAHATAVKLYKEKYQESQKGVIGITLVSHWMLAHSLTNSNNAAAQRAIDFMFGWYMDPLTRGDYPISMKSLVRKRLPKFTKEESKLVKGSFDFIGLNYYTARYAASVPSNNGLPPTYDTDSRANLTTERNGVSIGPQAASAWLYVYPPGIKDLLVYIKERYNNPVIYITENGIDEFNNASLSLKEQLNDKMRIKYYSKHLAFVRSAIREGVNVKGYFAWSLLDNFEWVNGYTVRFGICYVDYKNGLKRYPKKSFHWFKKFLTT